MAALARLLYFLRLGRPLFLLGGVVLHLLGVAIALYDGAALDIAVLLCAQVAVTAVQLMTHYSNDYFDLAADKANLTPTRWSGGSGILPAGLIAPSLALVTAVGAGLLGLGAALWLALALPTGFLTLPLLLLALLLAWGYSAPPLRLHSTGLGEIAGGVLVSGLTPLVGYYLQTGRLAALPFLAVIPLVLLQFIMLVLIEFPDARGDEAVGKNTLVVRMGAARAARLLQALIALYVLLLPVLWLSGLPALVTVVLALFSVPGLLWLAARLRQSAWAQPSWWNWLGFTGIALVFGSAMVQLVVFTALFAAGG